MKRIPVQWLWLMGLVAVACLSFEFGRRAAPFRAVAAESNPASAIMPASSSQEPTRLYAHNLLLRKGPHFRVYARWIRGQMLRTRADRNPSFDAPESFVLEIQKGVIHVRLADLADFLNSGQSGKPALKNISIENEEGQLRVHGTAHKLVPLPIRLDGVMSPLPDGRLKYHVVKLNVLKIPMKGLLKVFSVELSDLVKDAGTNGVEVSGNDIFFDTQKLLPPPHIHGRITSVAAAGQELKIVYGGVTEDDGQLAQWHNFLRLVGGTVDFGKLTMRQTDLTMIDASQDPWFDLDLVNYQSQLVNGTTRMTSRAGLEVYMPDIDRLPPQRKSAEAVTLEWLKNRNTSPPMDVDGAK